MSTMLEDIRSNTIETLHLSNVPKDYFSSTTDFVTALKGNTSVEEVAFNKDFLACIYGRDRGSVLDAVASLPNLQEVELADTCLMVSALTDFVKSIKGLRSFTMERLVLQGVQADFDALEYALLHKTGLKQFRVNDCDTANEGIDLEKIVNAGTTINVNSMETAPTQVKKSAIAA